MDYRKLLMLYIIHIRHCEGSDYIENFNFADSVMIEEEVSELHRLAGVADDAMAAADRAGNAYSQTQATSASGWSSAQQKNRRAIYIQTLREVLSH